MTRRRKRKWIVGVLILALFLLLSLYLGSNREKKDLNETTREKLGGTYITLSKGVTHYELIGDERGQVVVLVSGATLPMWVWDPQVRTLTETGFRVLRYDNYGRGYSDRPRVDYNRDLYREQLLELLDALGLTEPVDLIGHSFGGATVINFTAYHPERVRRLVLVSPLVNSTSDLRTVLAMKLSRVPILGDFLMRTVIIPMSVHRAHSLVEGVDVAADRYDKLYREQTTYKGFENSTLSMFRGDAMGDYREVYHVVARQNRKVMLIWGTADKEQTRERMEEARRAIPGMQFYVLEGVGHSPNFQVKEQFNTLLTDFLG